MTEPVRAASSRRRERRVSLRRRLAAAFLATALVFVVGGGVVAWSYARQVDARGRVLQRLDPAGIQLHDYFIGLLDQETGVRGYAITTDPQFLGPYETGVVEQANSAKQLHTLLRGEPAARARFAELEAASRAWQAASGDPLINAVRSRGTGAVTAADLSRGKTLFDVVRTNYGAALTALSDARRAAVHRIDSSQRQVILSLSVVAFAVLWCAWALWYGLRRLVLEPVERLAEATRVVTAGDTSVAIHPEGPAEIVELAADVEAMRARIVEDLDFTESARARIEQQATDLSRSNAELEQFAYVASHDLQEPLRKVASFCQLLEQRYGDEIDERGKQYIGFAVDGAKRMQALILDLLEFSRVGRTTERLVPVSLEHAADRALLNLSSTIEERHASVRIGPLPTIDGDESLLVALFQNLVGNGVKFNDSTAPVVTLTAVEVDEGWEIACRDNGIGIQPEYADRVFAIFQRLHGRDAYDGTGIGLALCRKIVEYHGGRIWVDPDATAGATIRFILPTHAPRRGADPLVPPTLPIQEAATSGGAP
ncbi:MAG: multi-sensor signal transduction histidine kinase [Actinomycetia bacterium]|nr:multi-sensor signal transduction histidine kinase [Actinomycetes bacterium]